MFSQTMTLKSVLFIMLLVASLVLGACAGAGDGGTGGTGGDTLATATPMGDTGGDTGTMPTVEATDQTQ